VTPVETLQQVVSVEPVPPSRLQPKVPRDLETICLKCLQKDPAKRYATAEALADDLRRFQSGEPILARPVGRVERLGRWCRRHPGVAVLTGLLMLVFLLGLGGVLWEWREAVRQEQEAREARDLADTERAKAEAINHFLIEDLLKAARPNQLGRQVTLKQALDKAEPRIARAFAGKPEIEAAVRTTLGSTYWRLGFFAQAEPQLRRALELDQQVLPPHHSDRLMALNNLGLLLQEQGKLAEAEPLLRKALEGFRESPGKDRFGLLTALHNLATLLFEQGKLADAEPFMREVLEECRRKYGLEQRDTLEAQNNLALLLRVRGNLAEAEPLCRQTYEICRRVLGPRDDLTLAATNNLAALLYTLDKLAEAEPVYRQLVADCRVVLGPEHPNRLQAIYSLARVLHERGKCKEAEKLGREVLRLRRKVLPANHPSTALSLALVGAMLLDAGKVPEAVVSFREALAIQRKALPKGNVQTAETENLLGACLGRQGNFRKAEPLLLGSYSVLARHPGVSPRHKRAACQRIIKLYEAWGKPAKAAQWRRRL
jgi:tetratricopeptide (TPR) repeat protein